MFQKQNLRRHGGRALWKKYKGAKCMNKAAMDEIERVLEERVRPELARHGGDIQVEGLESDVLRVRLLGRCSGCPSAELTMESLVEEKLRAAIPALKQVVLVTGVSDALLEQARQLLQERHSS